MWKGRPYFFCGGGWSTAISRKLGHSHGFLGLFLILRAQRTRKVFAYPALLSHPAKCAMLLCVSDQYQLSDTDTDPAAAAIRQRIGTVPIFFLAAMVGVLSFAFAAQAQTVNAPPVLKVGVILPLTGEGAGSGTAVRNGMLMAIDQLSPGEKEKLVFLFEDSELQSKSAVAAYLRLASMQGIQALVSFSSGPCNALAPLAEERKMPFIAIASDPHISGGRSFS